MMSFVGRLLLRQGQDAIPAARICRLLARPMASDSSSKGTGEGRKEPGKAANNDGELRVSASWFNVLSEIKQEAAASNTGLSAKDGESKEGTEPASSTWFTAPATASATDVTTSEPVADTVQETTVTIDNKERKLVKFENLPILKVEFRKNNTRMTLCNVREAKIFGMTAGMAGFKNSKRGTNVAGQACGEMVAKKARSKGYSFVRCVICGMGKARNDALKGLEIGGLRIVSLTDNTMHIPTGNRAKKTRRI